MKTLAFLKTKLTLLPALLLISCQPTGIILMPTFSFSNSSVIITGIVSAVSGLFFFSQSKGFRKKAIQP